MCNEPSLGSVRIYCCCCRSSGAALVNNAHNELAADLRGKTRKNARAETSEVIKIEHLVDERRCMMER